MQGGGGLTPHLVEWVPEIGASALLAGVVVLVLTGRLVPVRELEYWRAAYFTQQDQIRELMMASQATREVLLAAKDAVENPPVPRRRDQDGRTQ